MARSRGGTKIGIQVNAADGVSRPAQQAGQSIRKLAEEIAKSDSKIASASDKMSESLAKQAMAVDKSNLQLDASGKPIAAFGINLDNLAKKTGKTGDELLKLAKASADLEEFAQGFTDGTKKATSESTRFRNALQAQVSVAKDVDLTLRALSAEAGSNEEQLAQLTRTYENNVAKLKALKRAHEDVPELLLAETVAAKRQIDELRKLQAQARKTADSVVDGAEDQVEATGKTATAVSRVRKAFGGLRGLATPAAAAIAASFAAAAAAAAAVSKVVNDTAQEFRDFGNEAFLANQRVGITPELFSTLGFAARGLGEDTNAVVDIFKDMSQKAQTGSQDFVKWGISATDSSGKIRSSEAIFNDAIDVISGLGSEIERTAAVQQIFGESGLKLLPVLRKGKDGLAEMDAEAKRLGVSIDATAAALGAQLDTAFVQLAESSKGLKTTFGEVISPVLIPVIETIANQFAKITEKIEGSDSKLQEMVRSGISMLLKGVGLGVDAFEFLRKTIAGIETVLSLVAAGIVKVFQGALFVLREFIGPFEEIFEGFVKLNLIDTNPLRNSLNFIEDGLQGISDALIENAVESAEAFQNESQGAKFARESIDELNASLKKRKSLTAETSAITEASNRRSIASGVALRTEIDKVRQEYKNLRDEGALAARSSVSALNAVEDAFVSLGVKASDVMGLVQNAMSSIVPAISSAFELQPAEEQLISLKEEFDKLQASMSGMTGDELVRARDRIAEIREEAGLAASQVENDFKRALGNIGKAVTAAAIQFITATAAKVAAEMILKHVSIGGIIGLAAGIAGAGVAFAAVKALTSKVPKPENFNTGGIVGGRPGAIDSVPAFLTAGEAVLPVTLTDALRRVLAVPSGAAGGAVPAGTTSATSTGADTGGGMINVNVSSFVPQSKFAFRRMVRDELVPELLALNQAGMLRLA